MHTLSRGPDDRPFPLGLDTTGVVYYVTSEHGGVIKIGTTIDLDRRMLTLQQKHSGVTLRLLAVESGGELRERERHRQFAHLRQCVEWFWAAPELLAHIAGLDS